MEKVRDSDKVLIVDDEVDTCSLLGAILKKRNFRTSFANSLSEATIALKKETPSLLFLDNMLPDGSGLGFIPFIKENYPEVRIIMITAHDSSADMKKAYEQGADSFLGKPFNKELIYKTVDDLREVVMKDSPELVEKFTQFIPQPAVLPLKTAKTGY